MQKYRIGDKVKLKKTIHLDCGLSIMKGSVGEIKEASLQKNRVDYLVDFDHQERWIKQSELLPAPVKAGSDLKPKPKETDSKPTFQDKDYEIKVEDRHWKVMALGEEGDRNVFPINDEFMRLLKESEWLQDRYVQIERSDDSYDHYEVAIYGKRPESPKERDDRIAKERAIEAEERATLARLQKKYG